MNTTSGQQTLSIGITGCTGRVGRLLVLDIISGSNDLIQLSGATLRPSHALNGHDIGTICGHAPININASDDVQALFEKSDVVIDFTTPDSTMKNVEIARQTGTAIVIGTTGLNTAQEQTLNEAAKDTVIVYAANMSVGVNILLALVEKAATLLDPSWDIEIHEVHHKHKIDAPSGTALALGHAAASGRKIDLLDNAIMSREGETGPRPQGDIGFSVQRGGDVVGEHNISFYGQGERIELGHKAMDRSLFAKGAIKAAIWTHDKTNGIYSMKDVLNIE